MTTVIRGTDDSASTPALTGTDADTGIFFPAANTMAMSTGGSERVRVDSSGNVGIGTSAPVTKLNLIDALAGGQLLVATNQTNATEKYGTFGTQHYTNAEEPALGMATQSNATDNIILVGGALSEFNAATQVRFYTAADNTTVTGTERARIDSSGNLLVGTTSPITGATKLTVSGSHDDWMAGIVNTNASPRGLFVKHNTDSNGTANWFLYCEGSSTQRASIRSNGGLANFSANNVNLSDRREKTNFAPAKNYLDTICAIPVQTFNYIDQNHEEDPGLTLGVVAQDVQEVAPELVMESNWGSKEEPKMRLSVYQTDLQYALMKSIQELKAINDAQAQTIESLTTRIAALEAKG